MDIIFERDDLFAPYGCANGRMETASLPPAVLMEKGHIFLFK
jgi:hypothetical protein